MSVAKVIEITSQSTTSFEDAITTGIARANQSLKNVKGAWIQDQSVEVADGANTSYRVSMRVTFILADD